MVSTPEGFTDSSIMSPGPSVTMKNPSARKSLYQFFEVLYFKQKTSVQSQGAKKSKRNTIRPVIILWYSIPKRRVHNKQIDG